jgi:hypothetical protein
MTIAHLHFDGKPFAGIGADDLPVQLPLNVQIDKPRAETNAPKREFRVFP